MGAPGEGTTSIRGRYRSLVPLSVRRPIGRVRTAPRDLVLRSPRVAATKRGRALQDHLRRRQSQRHAGDRSSGGLTPLATLVQDDLAVVERRARHQAASPSRFSFLAAHLEASHDTYLNRCSPAHLRSMHERFADEEVQGRTVLEVGVGTQNPYGLLRLLVLLGAEQAIGLEPEEVEDELVAARTAALTVSWLLTAPQMVLGDHPAPAATIAARAAELDCERLWRGDLSALEGSRVSLVHRTADDTGLPDADVDLVLSNSVLEHLEHPTEDLAELHRITRPGGRACHAIDASDHHRYSVEGLHQLTFLEVESPDLLVHGSNRLRPHQLAELAGQAGFVVDELRPTVHDEVDEAMRAGFVEPYRSMPIEQLSVTHALLRAHRPVEDAAD
jgi:SAM-dependent methyltransferase